MACAITPVDIRLRHALRIMLKYVDLWLEIYKRITNIHHGILDISSIFKIGSFDYCKSRMITQIANALFRELAGNITTKLQLENPFETSALVIRCHDTGLVGW